MDYSKMIDSRSPEEKFSLVINGIPVPEGFQDLRVYSDLKGNYRDANFLSDVHMTRGVKVVKRDGEEISFLPEVLSGISRDDVSKSRSAFSERQIKNATQAMDELEKHTGLNKAAIISIVCQSALFGLASFALEEYVPNELRGGLYTFSSPSFIEKAEAKARVSDDNGNAIISMAHNDVWWQTTEGKAVKTVGKDKVSFVNLTCSWESDAAGKVAAFNVTFKNDKNQLFKYLFQNIEEQAKTALGIKYPNGYPKGELLSFIFTYYAALNGNQHAYDEIKKHELFKVFSSEKRQMFEAVYAIKNRASEVNLSFDYVNSEMNKNILAVLKQPIAAEIIKTLPENEKNVLRQILTNSSAVLAHEHEKRGGKNETYDINSDPNPFFAKVNEPYGKLSALLFTDNRASYGAAVENKLKELRDAALRKTVSEALGKIGGFGKGVWGAFRKAAPSKIISGQKPQAPVKEHRNEVPVSGDGGTSKRNS